MRSGYPIVLVVALLVPSCSGDSSGRPLQESAQDSFWNALESLCDQAFEGTLITAPAGDTSFAGKELVMHVRQCAPDEIRIPFHAGDDRSRTWILSRLPNGLRLKHDHRHEDGSPDAITQYGGDTSGPGDAEVQEFLADSATAAMTPAAATNVWTVEVHPGRSFVYALRREGTDRRFRIEFDIMRAIPLPPTPWGY